MKDVMEAVYVLLRQCYEALIKTLYTCLVALALTLIIFRQVPWLVLGCAVLVLVSIKVLSLRILRHRDHESLKDDYIPRHWITTALPVGMAALFCVTIALSNPLLKGDGGWNGKSVVYILCMVLGSMVLYPLRIGNDGEAPATADLIEGGANQRGGDHG